jgi:hypothetical protein
MAGGDYRGQVTGAFEVELLTWDKLCELLQLHETVRETF